MSGCFCCTVVENTDVGIIERLGKFKKLLFPGLHFYIPCVESIVGKVSTRTEQLELISETKTKDNVFVKLKISVQYKVGDDDVFDAFYSLRNPILQMSSYIEDSIRGIVPKIELDDLFEQTNDISTSVNDNVSNEMKKYGYTICKTLVTDIIPDQEVKRAMNSTNAAKREKLTAIEKGEAEKILRIKSAEAESEMKRLQGEGVAQQRQAIIRGYKDSICEFSKETQINPEETMILTLTTQYFDMLRDIGMSPNGHNTFVNHSPSSISDIRNEFRNAILESNPPKNIEMTH